MAMQAVLIGGQWQPARSTSSFRSVNPATGQPLEREYPVSSWDDCDAALQAAVGAFAQLRKLPGTRIATFLLRMAERIEASKDVLVETAHLETALPKSPRLADVELPRTTNQLRLAAEAARTENWRQPIIDTQAGLRMCFGSLGPVCVFGPNNFPFAFGSASGGDFAAAIAAGNPVIAKANTSHPETTRLMAIEAAYALAETGLPPATVQMIYRTSHEDGGRLVSDPRVGATGYTGSRHAGLELKRAADQAGKPIYLELSSVNPVVILPGALRERSEAIRNEFVTSGLMGTGQFCTNPGLVMLVDSPESRAWVAQVADHYRQTAAGILLSAGVQKNLSDSVATLRAAGGELLAGDTAATGTGFRCPNTVLLFTGDQFLAQPETLQTEAFGNAAVVVLARDVAQMEQMLQLMEGNLTGCIYSHTGGEDDADYDRLADALRQKVGRLLNDKMPTGVAVSPAMNHGGPYPATGHPGFTAVGIPTSIPRFAMLHSYDGVRPHRLPACLQDPNPIPGLWRRVDGQWTSS